MNIFIPRNHKDILKKVSVQERARAQQQGKNTRTAVKAVRKELRSSNISRVV